MYEIYVYTDLIGSVYNTTDCTFENAGGRSRNVSRPGRDMYSGKESTLKNLSSKSTNSMHEQIFNRNREQRF